MSTPNPPASTPLPRSFILDGDTLLRIADGPPMPSLTITGLDGSDPVITFGLIEGNVFVYPGGARLHWDAERAWWTGPSLMVGSIAIAVP